MANTATNNDIHKDWIIVVAPNNVVPLTRSSFFDSRASIVGGYDSQADADAAYAAWLADEELDHAHLYGAVVYEPLLVNPLQ